MDDTHIDANGVAGLLGEITGMEMTSVMRHCGDCGGLHAVGEHLAYRGAGIVLRCPSCGSIAARIVVRDAMASVDWRGVYDLPRV